MLRGDLLLLLAATAAGGLTSMCLLSRQSAHHVNDYLLNFKRQNHQMQDARGFPTCFENVYLQVAHAFHGLAHKAHKGLAKV